MTATVNDARESEAARLAGKSESHPNEKTQIDSRSQTTSSSAKLPWYRSTLKMAMLGAVLMAVALPPWDLWPLGWIAPIPWLLLVRQKELTGWRPYRAIYLAGFAFWFCVLHWLRLPHPATAAGWVALSFYLAFYIPIFVGLSRVGVHRLRIPLIVIAPLVWTGIELVKGHMLGGFTMGSPGHTQYRWLQLIQMADFAGAYGVSGLVMAVAACVATMLPIASDQQRWRWWPIVPAAALLGAALFYGYFKLDIPAQDSAGVSDVHRGTVALIQGSLDSEMKEDQDTPEQVFEHYDKVTRAALAAAAEQGKQVDLIAWPETMYRHPLFIFDESFVTPAGADRTTAEIEKQCRDQLIGETEKYHSSLLFGIPCVRIFSEQRQLVFNSAVFVDRTGEFRGRYDKQGLVMFGEYIPFADQFPFLYKLTPLSGGAVPGREPLSVDVHGLRYSPSICFETVIPHLIAGQVRQLKAEGKEPDVLVNLTNDGWFWGSSELDLHLICGVFRAVENRKPLLIAANTGFSAWIDGNGRIVQQGKRRETDFILADISPDGRHSFYTEHGDILPGACLTFCGFLSLFGIWDRRKNRSLPVKTA